MIKIKDIINHLESYAPVSYQESYDNSGLLVGDKEAEITRILISLDATEEVVEEAIQSGCNLIISHHPVIFKGIKKLTGSNYIERTILKSVKNDIALYAIHTNLDNIINGVNRKIAEKLGLENLKILSPKTQILNKLSTFIPRNEVEKVTRALFDAGAGNIGNYSECSYQTEGTGTFRPGSGSNPAIGEAGKSETVEETRVEVILPSYKKNQVLRALYASHPYEEPAYDLLQLENPDQMVGSGMIGELKSPSDELAFLADVKTRLGCSVIKYTKLKGKPVKKVAVCGGSGGFLLKDAIGAGADIFITADYKYHEFFDAENKIVIADVGHYESEICTKELIYEILIQKFTNIAVILANTVTNPISYL
jgi:dinuclear metal center YbgI/SA1388 family protein